MATAAQTDSEGLSEKHTSLTTIPTLKSRLWEKFPREHAAPILLGSSFITGLVDAAVYNAWTCFAAMQTGNTIFLALGASNQPLTKPYGWSKSLMSIGSFFLGSFFTTRIANAGWTPDAASRVSLAVNFFLQAVCLFVAAGIVESGFVYGSGSTYKVHQTVDFRELLPIFFTAAQFGAQISVSRILNVGEIPTTVLTSVYTDIAIDPKIIAPWSKNPKRNNRVLTVVLILAGGIVGGWIARTEAGLAGALWTAGGIKALLALGWVFMYTAKNGATSAV